MVFHVVGFAILNVLFWDGIGNLEIDETPVACLKYCNYQGFLL